MVFDTPPYKTLAGDPAGPKKNAWGIFGADDQLGTLNHLDEATVRKAAASEIKTGTRISLSLPMDFISKPAVGRKAFTKTFIHRAPRDCNDDEWSFNSQASSQWDGFRHFGVNKRYYNGRTLEDFEKSPHPNGIHHFKNGICGRGVLIDVHGRRKKSGLRYQYHAKDQSDPSIFTITLNEILDVLEAQKVTLLPGDILLLRTGWTEQYRDMSREELEEYHSRETRPPSIGAEITEELLEWLWDNKIATVCSDNKSFEKWSANSPRLVFHERALAGWGMPIGELFDLDGLALACERDERYTFFFVGTVVYVEGAVASPANCIAIR